MKEEKRIYRVIFSQEDKIYEVFAQYITEESLVGFIEIEELVFSEHSPVVVDPSEEKLKNEFRGVKRSYIPMHMILRIDEMEKRGTPKIKAPKKQNNVHYFKGYSKPADQE